MILLTSQPGMDENLKSEETSQRRNNALWLAGEINSYWIVSHAYKRPAKSVYPIVLSI